MISFDELRNHIGEKVILYYYHNDATISKITDVLKDVDDYYSITIGNVSYPFISKVAGIGTIATLDGKVIYDNPIINEAYKCADDEELEECKKEMYGEDYKVKRMAYNRQKHTVKPKSVN